MDIDSNLLPESLKPIAELIGMPSTISLVERYGGGRLYIPRNANNDHALVQVLGREAVEALASVHAGESIELPLATAALRRARDMEIYRRYNSGDSAEQLAKDYGATRRHIYRIVGQIKKELEPESVSE